MSEDLGNAVLTLNANPGPLTKGLAAAKAKTLATMKGTSIASAAAFAAGMVAVGAAVGIGLYKVGKQFDEAYNIIRTGTGATGKELEALKSDFRAVFRNVPEDAKTVGTAIADLNTRLGLTGEELQSRAKQFIDLSRITGTDVATNIKKVSHMFRDWEVATEDQEKTLDGLFRVSQATGIGVDDLSGKVQQFGSPLRQLGFSVGEAASLFGVFEAAGVNVSTLMPGFKMAIKNVIQPTDNMRESMRKLGIDMSAGPEAAVKQFIELLYNADDPLEHAGAAMDLFGARAGSDMIEAISQGRLNLEDMLDVFENGEETISKAAEETLTFSERLDILKNRGMLALERPAMLLMEGLEKLADVLIAVTDAIDSMPDPVKKTIGQVLLLAGGALALIAALAKVRAAFMGIQALMMANPYLLLIAATVGIAVLIVKNWDDIKEFLENTWSAIKDGVGKGWSAIRDLFKKHWKVIAMIPLGPLAFMVGLIVKNWDRIRDVTGRVWARVRDLITAPFRAAGGAVNSVASSTVGFVSGKWNAMRDKTSAAWASIRDRITSPVRTAKDTVTNIITGLTGWLSRMWDRITTGVERMGIGMRNAIVAAFTGLYDIIKKKIEDITNLPGLKQIKGLASSVGGLLSAPASVPVTGSGFDPFSSSASSTGQPQVNIDFADGMGWLKNFVNVEIEGHGHEAAQVYLAGAGRIG